MIFVVTKNRVRRKYRSVDDPNTYVLVEAFRDRAAGEDHVNSQHFKNATMHLPELLAAVPEIVNVEVAERWSRVKEGPVDASGS
jgi:heme-degrading monooxygenase HmoA